jgi:D-alanine-D-alanine ligase-like ATP-grasp enzyme
MAVCSQNHEQTKTDFRKYLSADKGINRYISFQLPDYIEIKLTKLMVGLGLETGSIDLILTNNGQFIFLEVNPVGQFGMTSAPCNYHIEKDIAQQLILFNV